MAIWQFYGRSQDGQSNSSSGWMASFVMSRGTLWNVPSARSTKNVGAKGVPGLAMTQHIDRALAHGAGPVEPTALYQEEVHHRNLEPPRCPNRRRHLSHLAPVQQSLFAEKPAQQAEIALDADKARRSRWLSCSKSFWVCRPRETTLARACAVNR